MKKIRVALLIDAWFPFRGGAQIQVREITKRLEDQCEFTVFHSGSSRLANRALWSLAVIPEVISAHRCRPFDLIHAHAYLPGIPGKILSESLRIPVVFSVHGANTLDLELLKKGGADIRLPRIKLALEKLLLTGIKYTRQITVSRSFLKFKNVNRPIRVIPNGVDTAEFDREKSAKNRQFTLIYVGRDDPVKGREYFDQALAILAAKDFTPQVLRVTGQVSDRKELIRLYKSAHLFVSSSLAEGQPLTLLEAWAAQLPVVVTGVGDNPLMVKPGINGYLVAPADSRELAEAIYQAERNPRLAGLGRSGYNLVKKAYSWEKAADQTLIVYKEVLNAHQ